MFYPSSSTYNEGFLAFERGADYANPYQLGTPEFDWFERGFFQAQKRSDCHFTSSGIRKHSIFSLLREAKRHMKDIASDH